jgi:putative protease
MKKVELLAPAGSIESLYAAVKCGADAVYLGGNKFSARAYASNFDEEKMAEVVKYCHIYDVKVYITINTLIKDSEMMEAIDYAKYLYEIGVDALIVQDLGFSKLLKKDLPDFEIHASTQMTVHNPEGALFLKSLGFKRIVLSRELSLKEVKYLSDQVNLETEIFIHGALCISYSGQCLMSSLIGGRSGNRGRCAQPCRLPYSLIEDITGNEKKGYLLSPKDICTLDVLKNVIETGTSSLKIEGRMKRPEYVAAVVSAYRKAIDSLYENKNNFDLAREEEKVLQLFNREGASKAYMFGNQGRDMMAYSNPKNSGLKLGEADGKLEVDLLMDLNVKDGISAGEHGFTVLKILKENVEVLSAKKNDRVRIFPQRYNKGDILFKTSDSLLLKELESMYSNPYERKVDVSLEVSFEVSKPVKINVTYKENKFTVFGALVQEAIKKPLEKDKLIENITKTQNTPFEFNIKIDSFEEGFIPVSSVNEIRRDVIAQIEKIESSRIVRGEIEPSFQLIKEKKSSTAEPHAMVIVNSQEQFRAAVESDLGNIAVDIFNKNSDIDLDKIFNTVNTNIYLKIPNIIKEEYFNICELVEDCVGKIKGLVTGNLGIINRYYDKTNIIGDYKLNIFNKETLNFYNSYLNLSCLSVELNKSEIKNILNKSNAQILLYGKIELMVSEYCVIGSVFGGKSKAKSCSRPCDKGSFTIKDRKGFKFNISMDKFCRSHIYNNAPLNLIPNIEELSKLGANYFRLDFIDEDYSETKKILESYRKGKFEDSFENYTRGHYKRGVE